MRCMNEWNLSRFVYYIPYSYNQKDFIFRTVLISNRNVDLNIILTLGLKIQKYIPETMLSSMNFICGIKFINLYLLANLSLIVRQKYKYFENLFISNWGFSPNWSWIIRFRNKIDLFCLFVLIIERSLKSFDACFVLFLNKKSFYIDLIGSYIEFLIGSWFFFNIITYNNFL